MNSVCPTDYASSAMGKKEHTGHKQIVDKWWKKTSRALWIPAGQTVNRNIVCHSSHWSICEQDTRSYVGKHLVS